MEPDGGCSGAAGASGPVLGTVRAFDEHRGLGILGDSGGGEWPFHCTAITDGSRTIEVGTRVVFRPVPGHLGRVEATDIQRLEATGNP